MDIMPLEILEQLADKQIIGQINDGKLSVSCLICEDPITPTLEDAKELLRGNQVYPKICDKCKQTILQMRNMK